MNVLLYLDNRKEGDTYLGRENQLKVELTGGSDLVLRAIEKLRELGCKLE